MINDVTKVGATIPLPRTGKSMPCRSRAGGGLGRNAARTTLLLLTARVNELGPLLKPLSLFKICLFQSAMARLPRCHFCDLVFPTKDEYWAHKKSDSCKRVGRIK